MKSYLTGFDKIWMFFFTLFSAAVVILEGWNFRGKRFWLGWELLLHLGLEMTLAVFCSGGVVIQYHGCGQWEAAAQGIIRLLPPDWSPSQGSSGLSVLNLGVYTSLLTHIQDVIDTQLVERSSLISLGGKAVSPGLQIVTESFAHLPPGPFNLPKLPGGAVPGGQLLQ